MKAPGGAAGDAGPAEKSAGATDLACVAQGLTKRLREFLRGQLSEIEAGCLAGPARSKGDHVDCWRPGEPGRR